MLLAKRKLGSKFRDEIFVPRRQDCHIVTIQSRMRERQSHLSYTSLFCRTRPVSNLTKRSNLP